MSEFSSENPYERPPVRGDAPNTRSIDYRSPTNKFDDDAKRALEEGGISLGRDPNGDVVINGDRKCSVLRGFIDSEMNNLPVAIWGADEVVIGPDIKSISLDKGESSLYIPKNTITFLFTYMNGDTRRVTLRLEMPELRPVRNGKEV